LKYFPDTLSYCITLQELRSSHRFSKHINTFPKVTKDNRAFKIPARGVRSKPHGKQSRKSSLRLKLA